MLIKAHAKSLGIELSVFLADILALHIFQIKFMWIKINLLGNILH